MISSKYSKQNGRVQWRASSPWPFKISDLMLLRTSKPPSSRARRLMDSREEEFRDLRETQGEGERAYPVTETKKLGAPRGVQTTFVASPEGRNARDDCWFSTRARRCVGAHRQ